YAPTIDRCAVPDELKMPRPVRAVLRLLSATFEHGVGNAPCAREISAQHGVPPGILVLEHEVALRMAGRIHCGEARDAARSLPRCPRTCRVGRARRARSSDRS